MTHKIDDIQIVQQITSRISTTLELGRILEVSLEAMESSLGFEHSMILLADESGESLAVAASRGYPDPGIGVKVPIGQGVIGVVARRRRITRLGNVGTQRSYLANVRKRMEEAGEGAGLAERPLLPGLPDAESQIAIPLVVTDRLIGVLGVESRRTGAFDELDQILLTIISTQVAHAIDNARLHATAIERSEALDRANADLTRLNATLEKTVAERTAALSNTLDEMRRGKELSENLLRRMAPPAVIPLMIEDRLVARRLRVTVLFADLEGFTAFSSGLEPDEVFAHLNHFFSWAGEVIERYRGYINKTSGDGIMALFGVPFETSTHQTDAALAALALQSEIKERFPFHMRIGINSGTVTAGMLGPRNKSLYDVLGDAVNVASRMEALCPAGSVVASSATAEALQPYFTLQSLGELDVKGKGSMSCLAVSRIKPLLEDHRRVDPSSLFAERHAAVVEEVEAIKREALSMIDFPSIQARDVALGHNEAVASFALALLRRMAARSGDHLRDDFDAVAEKDLVLTALLHDVGKHAVDVDLLNRPSLSSDDSMQLRNSVREATAAVLGRLGFSSIEPIVRELYRFEETRGADGEYGAAVELLAAADIYDALTAPKRYKGSPWRISGALAELLRLPYCLARARPAFDGFVELMKPKDAEVHGGTRTRVVLR